MEKVLVKYDIKKRYFDHKCRIRILSLLLVDKINQSVLILSRGGGQIFLFPVIYSIV